MTRRTSRTTIALLVLGACFFMGAGLLAHRFVRSPADIAAASRPPDRSVITARVVRRRLSEKVVTRGTVSRARIFGLDVALDPSIAHPVVTRTLVRPGASIRSGQVVLEVSGRPIFVFQGRVPAYRDLGPGVSGRDVAQLQRALRALGFATGADRTGFYGGGTASAVGRLFRARGYEPVGPSTEELDAIDQARAGVREAAVALRAAVRHLGELRAQHASATARADARDQLRLAAAAAGDARARLRRLRAGTGVRLPASEVQIVPALPARVSAVLVRVGTVLDTVHGHALELVGGRTVVRGTLSAGDSTSVRIGARAFVDGETGVRVRGRLTSVGRRLTASRDGTGYRYEIRLRKSSLVPGDVVTVVIEGRRTGRGALVVPLTAIRSRADTTTEVLVAGSGSGSGSLREVPVRVGLSADGYVAVRPLGRLQPGDEVVVAS